LRVNFIAVIWRRPGLVVGCAQPPADQVAWSCAIPPTRPSGTLPREGGGAQKLVRPGVLANGADDPQS